MCLKTLSAIEAKEEPNDDCSRTNSHESGLRPRATRDHAGRRRHLSWQEKRSRDQGCRCSCSALLHASDQGDGDEEEGSQTSCGEDGWSEEEIGSGDKREDEQWVC